MQKRISVQMSVREMSLLLESLDQKTEQARGDLEFWKREKERVDAAEGRQKSMWPTVVSESVDFYKRQAYDLAALKKRIHKAWLSAAKIEGGPGDD